MSTILEQAAIGTALAFSVSAGAQAAEPTQLTQPQTFNARIFNHGVDMTVTPRGNVVLNQRNSDGHTVDVGVSCDSFAKSAPNALVLFATAAGIGTVSSNHETATPEYKAGMQQTNQEISKFVSLLENSMTACSRSQNPPQIAVRDYAKFYNQTRALKATLTP